MGFYRKSELKRRAESQRITKAMATDSLKRLSNSSRESFDIFLSHRYIDAEEIIPIVDDLQAAGFVVYVDWQVDPGLDRGKVTKGTAALLRKRMRQCKALVFASSENSSESKWMPWELGFMDAFSGKVAIIPVVNDFYAASNFVG